MDRRITSTTTTQKDMSSLHAAGRTGMTAKRGRRREKGPGEEEEEEEKASQPGNEERDGIAGRAKASGIKLKENGVCSPLFFWVLVEGLHYIYWM